MLSYVVQWYEYISHRWFISITRFERNVPECLTVGSYYPVLYKASLSGLHQVKFRLEQGLPSSLGFISQLIGKLCLHGLGIPLWTTLLANIMVSIGVVLVLASTILISWPALLWQTVVYLWWVVHSLSTTVAKVMEVKHFNSDHVQWKI